MMAAERRIALALSIVSRSLAKIFRLWPGRNIGRAKPIPQRKMRARRRAKWGVEKT
jgi:hypothetical protein